MKNQILVITFLILLITLSSCQDNIKNLELYYPRSTGTLLIKLSDNELYTAECYTYGEKVCYTEEGSKKMKIVEKKCFDFGNNCFFKIESLEDYKFNNSLKTSRFALLQLKREGGKYHLTSTNLVYDEKVIHNIQLTKTLFSDKELNDRVKKYFSPKAKPEPYTWVFYAKSYLESLNLLNLPVDLDSKFNNDLEESLMKEIKENNLKQSEYDNFINNYLIEKRLNPAFNRMQVRLNFED